jgi:HAD superfamily hydrolase (TIGR01490 family)
MYYLGIELLKYRYVTPIDLMRFTWWQMRFIGRKVEDPQIGSSLIAYALKAVAGKTPQEIDDLCARAVRRYISHQFIPETIAELRRHQMANRQVWLATASPIEIGRAVARELGIDVVIGTQSEIVNGKYSGKLQGETTHGIAKATAVKLKAAELDIDLQSSFAYSDSLNDLPLLALVGRPTVVNANRSLEMIANKNLWPIIRPKGARSVRNDWSEFIPNEMHPILRLKERPGRDHLVRIA